MALLWQLAAWSQASDPPDVLAQKIDQFLAGRPVDNNKRPLVGSGADFVQWGGTYQVNPRLIVAISGAESTFGAHICTSNNAWNWFWEGPCPKSPFDTWSSGIHTVSHFLEKSYILKGYNTIPLIGHRYCTEGCQNWQGNVTSFYQALGGDMTTLAWVPGEAEGPPAQPAQPPPTPQPQPETPPPQPSPEAAAAEPGIEIRTASPAPPPTDWMGRPTSGSTITLTAAVSGAQVAPASLAVYRVIENSSAQIGSLRPTGSSDSSGALLFGGQVSIGDPKAQSIELLVSGKLRVTGHSKLVSVRSDPFAITTPPPAGGMILWILIAVGGLLLAGIIIVIVVRATRKRGVAATGGKAAGAPTGN